MFNVDYPNSEGEIPKEQAVKLKLVKHSSQMLSNISYQRTGFGIFIIIFFSKKKK